MNDYVILRHAELCPTEAAIVCAVARAWSCGRRVTVRDLKRELPGASYYLYGHKDRARLNLVQLGWLQREWGVNRSLRPGPRFKGLDRSWPLELVV